MLYALAVQNKYSNVKGNIFIYILRGCEYQSGSVFINYKK